MTFISFISLMMEKVLKSNENELKKIAALAHIETNDKSASQLAHDVSAIMDFVEQLRQVDTSSVQPLLHPLNLHQRLRLDEIKEKNCVAELAKIAPVFTDDLYLVPKVIETTGK